jgi:hypothetical protein
MKIKGWTGIIAAAFLLVLVGCKKETNPTLGGQITLSSQLHGTESFYINGFLFEKAEMVRYHLTLHENLPDIINEGFPVINGSEELSEPGFNTPGRVNGFALVGEFSNLTDANAFFQDYTELEEGLEYQMVSDTVKLYQVWVQQTSAGNFVKMVIRDIAYLEAEAGQAYSEVSLEYTYSPGGSTEFDCGCD